MIQEKYTNLNISCCETGRETETTCQSLKSWTKYWEKIFENELWINIESTHGTQGTGYKWTNPGTRIAIFTSETVLMNQQTQESSHSHTAHNPYTAIWTKTLPLSPLALSPFAFATCIYKKKNTEQTQQTSSASSAKELGVSQRSLQQAAGYLER